MYNFFFLGTLLSVCVYIYKLINLCVYPFAFSLIGMISTQPKKEKKKGHAYNIIFKYYIVNVKSKSTVFFGN